MFDNFFKLFKKQESSKDLAKERLKLVLIHDKANVSPQFLEMIKDEIIKVIKKYIEIDENSLDIQLTKQKSDEGDRIVPSLIANIPIINVKEIVPDKITAEVKKEEKREVTEEKEESPEVKKSENTVKPKRSTKKNVKKQ